MIEIAEMFFQWASENDVPFFAVFSALIGVVFIMMFAAVAAIEGMLSLAGWLAKRRYRKDHSND